MSAKSYLQLLGTPRLTSRGNGAEMPLPRKAFVLAAILLLAADSSAPRAALAARLWEDLERDKALDNMRQLAGRIRGQGPFIVTRDSIEARRDIGASDLALLLSLGPIATADALDEAVALYRGDLLDGVDGLELGLARWIDAERRRIRDHFTALVTAGAQRVGGEAALQALRRLAEITPYDEQVCHLLLTALADAGRTQELALTYQTFRSRLRDDLQVQPSAEIEELFMRLSRRGDEPRPRPAAAPRGGTTAASAHADTPTNTAGIPHVALLMPQAVGGKDALRDAVASASALLEDVTIGLCRLRSLAMIAPYSAWQFSKRNFLDRVRPYNIDYVLESRVGHELGAGGGLRLDVKLIHTTTRQISWAEKYSFQPGDIAERYRDLTNRIVRTLADAVEQAEIVKHSTIRDPGAYALYLNGRQNLRVLDLPNLRRARKLFAAAVEKAPNFSLAYSGLARTFLFEWVLRAQDNKQLLEEARRAAEHAVALDPFDGDGQRELGRAELYLGNLDGGLGAFAEAEGYAPHHADLLADHADALTHNSELEKAKSRIDSALDLNPLPPDEYLWTSGGVNFFLGNYELALGHLQRMKNADPALKLMAACAARSENKSAARKYRERAMALNPGFDVEAWISKLPLRDPHQRKEYADALKTAGFH
jgi:DNA-binding SARP family transcriptional activator/TolB-like protein